MAVTVKNKLIIEDIIDEQGNKLGEIKFNPEDSRIMEKLTNVINVLTNSKKRFNSLGDIDENAFKKEAIELEDFEKYSETYQKVHEGFQIEYEYNATVIKDLTEIFGKETIELFTKGSYDIETLMPLINYVIPIVQGKRNEKVNKYLNKNKQPEVLDVME